jgi:DNA polymerase I-like protein with 3'-5' exonuclease and polymerase domains
MNKTPIYIDFESYYDSKTFTLKKMSMIEYVRSPEFKAFGLAYAWADNANGPVSVPVWVPGSQIPNFCSKVANAIGWPNIAMVGHNVKFDATILREVYECVPGQFVCTKAMSKAVFAKSIKGHSLADLAEHFGLQSKGVMKTDGLRELTAEQEKELADYCIRDVELCRKIFDLLRKDFPESQYEAMHRTVSMFVNSKLQLNAPLLEKTAKEEALRRETIFKEIGIDKKEFASNAKFPKLLEREGYSVPTKSSPRTGKIISALALGDPEFLEMAEEGNERLKTLCEARIAAKSTLLETRSSKLAAIGRTGLWPFDVEFSGADQTHRFSGGSGAGGNPQNFTRDSALREAVEAPQDYSLVVGDFSNIELRIVAYLSKDLGLVQAIEAGVDLYCDFASVFYGRKITKADAKERRFGKCAILGLGYGMGATKFAKTVRLQTGETLTEEQARKAVDLYRTRYGGVPRLWEKLDDSIIVLAGMVKPAFEKWDLPVTMVKEAIILPSLLKVRYPNLRQVKEERRTEWVYDVYNKRNLEQRKIYGAKLLENITQALAGELCKTAMLKMGENVTGLVHDEIHVLCKRGLESPTAQKLKRVMSVSPSWLPNMKLDAEVGWGKSWGNAK